MRVLIVIPHYCDPSPDEGNATFGSRHAIAPRVFALRACLIALKRYFGGRRLCGPHTELRIDPAEQPTLDIVIATVEGRNVLPLLAIDPTEYAVEFCAGDPLFLIFETQRIARERAGSYDLIGMMEDDLVIGDPMFFEKILWFADRFGPDRILQPHRVEISRAGRIGKTLIEPTLSEETSGRFRHASAPQRLSGDFAGRRRHFEATTNPHSGCWFLTRPQLEAWSKEPSFYDRKADWVGPLESGATRALALRHQVYRAVDPDPFFLEIEHSGVRFANEHLPAWEAFREDPFLHLPGDDDRQPRVAGPTEELGRLARLRKEHAIYERIIHSRPALLRRIARLTLDGWWKRKAT